MRTGRLSSLAIASSISIFIHAQNIVFEQIPEDSTNFMGVGEGSVAFADVDNDNDQDVVITGANYSSILYLNNGTGSFTTALNTPFAQVDRSSIAFADVDGDNDQDLLITGRIIGSYVAMLYMNDGNGIFTEALGTPFTGVQYSSVAFADIDNDNDLDVLITGQNPGLGQFSSLYINDGSGVFSYDPSTIFDKVIKGSIAFADVDNDNDQDVLITGFNESSMRIAKLYLNDGSGTFTESLTSSFEGTELGSVAFADIDNDNDQDVIITGWTMSFAFVANLYENDGSGVFTAVSVVPFSGVKWGTSNFADFDGDNDQDLLICGLSSSNIRIAELFENDGTGSFSEITPTVFDGIAAGFAAVADVDGQYGPDVLLTGENVSLERIAKLYRSSSTVGLEEISFVNETFIYPNPSSGLVNIKLGDQRTISINVFDQIGQLLHETVNANGPLYQLHLNENPGLYLIELIFEDGKQYSKLLIE